MERAVYIWEILAEVPVLRRAVCQIEELNDQELMVCELLAFFRDLDEMLRDLEVMRQELGSWERGAGSGEPRVV